MRRAFKCEMPDGSVLLMGVEVEGNADIIGVTDNHDGRWVEIVPAWYVRFWRWLWS